MIVLSCLRHRCNHNINMVFFLQNSYTFSRGCIWYMVNVLLFDHPRNKRQHLSCLLFVVFNWHFKDKNIFKRYIRLKLCKMYNLFRMHWVILEITFNWFFYCPIRIVNAPVKKKYVFIVSWCPFFLYIINISIQKRYQHINNGLMHLKKKQTNITSNKFWIFFLSPGAVKREILTFYFITVICMFIGVAIIFFYLLLEILERINYFVYFLKVFWYEYIYTT